MTSDEYRQLTELLHKQHATTQQRFDGIDQRFDGIDQRLDGMDQRFDGIDQRLDGIDQRLDGMDRRFNGIDGRLDGIDGRLDGIEAHLGRHDEQFIAIARHFDALGRSIGALEARLDAKIDAGFREQSAQILGLSARYERLEQEYFAIVETLRRIEGNQADDRRRRESLERRLGELAEEVALLRARVDALEGQQQRT